MNRAITAACLCVLICLVGTPWAGTTQAGTTWGGGVEQPGSIVSETISSADVLLALEAVKWSGPGITYNTLEGKTTVVLAVNADKTPRSAPRYIAERNFNGPNVIRGYHPNLHTQLGFKSNLFRNLGRFLSISRRSSGTYFGDKAKEALDKGVSR